MRICLMQISRMRICPMEGNRRLLNSLECSNHTAISNGDGAIQLSFCPCPSWNSRRLISQKYVCHILSVFVVIVGFCYCGICVTHLFAVRNYMFVVIILVYHQCRGNADVMAQSQPVDSTTTVESTSVFGVIGPSPAPKKSPNYYTSLKEHYEKFISENEILSVPSL